MVKEVVVLFVKSGEEANFENAMVKASEFISRSEGYIHHELVKSTKERNKYILMVDWIDIDAHKEGFRKSADYVEWKKLLHHYYDPFPKVEYFTSINL